MKNLLTLSFQIIIIFNEKSLVVELNRNKNNIELYLMSLIDHMLLTISHVKFKCT